MPSKPVGRSAPLLVWGLAIAVVGFVTNEALSLLLLHLVRRPDVAGTVGSFAIVSVILGVVGIVLTLVGVYRLAVNVDTIAEREASPGVDR